MPESEKNFNDWREENNEGLSTMWNKRCFTEKDDDQTDEKIHKVNSCSIIAMKRIDYMCAENEEYS